MSKKFKYCPFCGAEAYKREDGIHVIAHDVENCYFSRSYNEPCNPEETRRRWNKRKKNKCDNCKSYVKTECYCNNEEILSNINTDGSEVIFYPPKGFSCSKWEENHE